MLEYFATVRKSRSSDGGVVGHMLTSETRARKGKTSRVDRTADRLINLNEVAFRWNVTSPAARTRLEKAGVKILRFNERSAQVWLSDLLKLEAQVSS